jgi:hypothetical protein
VSARYEGEPAMSHDVEPVIEPTAVSRGRPRTEPTIPAERLALVDLLDRVLAGGVVVAGEVTLSIAEVDMVTVSLRALVTSVSALAGSDAELPGRGP